MNYAELHAKTNFSFLEGASHPDELVRRAAELKYAALAVTDRNSLAGVVRAHGAAKDLGVKLLIGAEITPHDAPPVVLLATDRAAYGRLARLITKGRRRAEKGECRVCFNDVAEHATGLIAAVIARLSPTPNPQLPTPPPIHNYREAFGDRCYLLAELNRGRPPEPSLAEQRDLMRSHYRMLTERFGSQKGTILMRRYACSYGQGRRGARRFRTRAARAATPEEFFAVVERDFPGGSRGTP